MAPNSTRVPVLVNHFSMQQSNAPTFQYQCLFTPDCDALVEKKRMMYKHLEALGGHFVFDGNTMFNPTKFDNRTVTEESLGNSYSIEIRFVKEVAHGTFAALQVHSIVFRKAMQKMNLVQLGRQFFNPEKRIEVLKHKIELWPGYFTSLHPSEGGTQLIVDVSHKVLRTETVNEYIMNSTARKQKNQLAMQNEIRNLLVGSYVLTRYNNKHYRCDDIAFDQSPLSTFDRKGQQISFAEYYKTAHNVTIRDMTQFMIVSKKKSRGQIETVNTVLVPELCYMTGMTDVMRDDRFLMQDLAIHTRVPPTKRVSDIIDLPQRLAEVGGEDFAKNGITIDTRPITANGIKLPEETMIFADNKRVPATRDADWTNAFRNSKLYDRKNLDNWVLIATDRDAAPANDFMKTLRTVAAGLGINVQKPNICTLTNPRDESFTHAIQEHVKPDTQIVVIILPTKKAQLYGTIKTEVLCKHGVPSQCIVAATLLKKGGLMSVVTKICVQMNCKMGGAAWSIASPIPGKVMIVGLDVCHDTKRKSQSVVGFTATMNAAMSSYFSKISIQPIGQEPVGAIQQCLGEALIKFRALNGQLPETIIVYRDGVGDGQLNMVAEFEVPQLAQVLKSIGSENYNPGLAVIIVKKRIHTRMFQGEPGAFRNPPPGTLVDRGITHCGWYDFYLVAQCVKEGTVTPTHYHVIFDNTRLEPWQLQQLSYKLCHMYFNWSGTIRVPAPCQYAHKNAFLNGQHVHQQVMPRNEDKLYYL